ncbi:MAG: caspase family protein [Gemmatimonadales bacterium]|jgi:hypothetical protein
MLPSCVLTLAKSPLHGKQPRNVTEEIMNQRRALLSLFLIGSAVLANTAEAQWQEQVEAQMSEFSRRIAAQGFQPVGESRDGSLDQGERESLTFALSAGATYIVVGFCDNDCTDLDLTLYDAGGQQIDIDVETDAAPVVQVSPARAASYRVEVSMPACSVDPCFYSVRLFSTTTAAGVPQPAPGTTQPMQQTGTLALGDDTLNSGEYADHYSFTGHQGEHVVIDLRSSEFDPYLFVTMPNGDQEWNDDYEGSPSRSLLSLPLTVDGTYNISVTSYKPGETGSYTLRIDHQSQTALDGGPRVERGSLAAGDDTLRSGEYVDFYDFQGQPGQQVVIDLTSDDFDTYVILKDPTGEQEENDDADRPGHSRLEAELNETGTYRVMVTSYEVGETGSYELAITAGVATASSAGSRDVTTLRLGESRAGQLSEGDSQLDNGEYHDIYVFDGQAGQHVAVDLTSSQFDTYLILLTPSGEDIQNDDYAGSRSRSRIDLTLQESGRYRLVATSYGAEETGAYEIAVQSTTEAVVAQAGGNPLARPARSGGGQVYGIFAGISDYPGVDNDLAYTADDAVRVRNALIRGVGMQPSNGVLLTDGEATRANVRNAIQALSSRMGPDDTFILFYSGHGSRVPRSDFQPTDPDALDETLELHDGAITDDEMRDLLDAVPADRTILLLDACFSGGFSKDVISVPGRMGMFSSEEDVTSAVAAKFRAGGYLALFVADGIGEHLADGDGNGELTALELSQYVHERYRADVKSGTNEFVRTGGPQSGYQHLVVDRGSIGPYDVILRW